VCMYVNNVYIIPLAFFECLKRAWAMCAFTAGKG